MLAMLEAIFGLCWGAVALWPLRSLAQAMVLQLVLEQGLGLGDLFGQRGRVQWRS